MAWIRAAGGAAAKQPFYLVHNGVMAAGFSFTGGSVSYHPEIGNGELLMTSGTSLVSNTIDVTGYHNMSVTVKGGNGWARCGVNGGGYLQSTGYVAATGDIDISLVDSLEVYFGRQTSSADARILDIYIS